MSKGFVEEIDIPAEFQNTPFERSVVLTLKQICKTIRNLEDRIEDIEKTLVR